MTASLESTSTGITGE